jgi:large subunit ribosomal protein L4
MSDIPVYTQEGEQVDEIEVDSDVFGEEVNVPLLKQAITVYESNQRQGSANTKRRSDTAYSNQKPWPQKNTGRARHGERGSPIWVGGGLAFGPQPRDYSKKFPKKMRRQALDNAFLAKLVDDQLKIIEDFDLSQPKTRVAQEVLEEIGVADDSLLILTDGHRRNAHLATRNLPDVELKPVEDANAYEVLQNKHTLIERSAFRSYAEERAKQLHDITDGAE